LSSKFSIIATTGTFIEIFQPNGGEEWMVGTSHLISWNDDLPGGVMLELYDRTSGSWDLVDPSDSGLPTTAITESTYSWNIPGSTSLNYGNTYRMKIYSSADNSIDDWSDGKFELLPYVKMSVYPNPADQVFTISLGNQTNANYSIELYNRFNQKVMENVFDSSISDEMTISTQNLTDGIYFLILTSNETRISKKIIVNHR